MTEFEVYQKLINPQDIVFDIGAHVGQMSRHFLTLGASHVYAFEPSPNNFDDLKRNVDGLAVTCFQVALHEKAYRCVTPFKDCRKDYIDATGKKIDATQSIQYVVLEDFMREQKLPNPNFLKIDIEGMESLVLNTFDWIFQSVRPSMYVEIHAQDKELHIQEYTDNPHWVWPCDGGFDFNLLKSFAYSLETSGGELLSVDANWNPPTNFHGFYILRPQ